MNKPEDIQRFFEMLDNGGLLLIHPDTWDRFCAAARERQMDWAIDKLRKRAKISKLFEPSKMFALNEAAMSLSLEEYWNIDCRFNSDEGTIF